jgi:hypothetical protein
VVGQGSGVSFSIAASTGVRIPGSGGAGRNFRDVRPVEKADFRKVWKRVGILWPMQQRNLWRS